MSARSKILLLLQFLCLGYFVLFSRIIASGPLLLIQLLGLALGVWSVFSMGLRNFNVQPEVKSGAILIRKGPYALIRNPMYTSLLLFFSAALTHHFSWKGFLVLLVLALVFAVKIRDEENFLTLRFGPVYSAYKKSTYRIIPYLF